MEPAAFAWSEHLRWIIPTVLVAAGLSWRLARPACESLVFRMLKGNPERHHDLVRSALAPEIEELDDHAERLAEAERMIQAHADTLAAVEQSLLQQGALLRAHIVQVFDPLQRTLTRIEGAMDRIAADTNRNSVAIGKLEGLWNGAERRQGGDRRTGE